MRTGYGFWNAEHGSAVMGSDREDHPEQRRGVDLRRSPRHRLVLPVDLAFENETSNALVLDLSENGCLIEAERRIELGETLQIEFYENPELRYKAKIIWGGDALYGCQFFQPIPETIVEEARLWTVPRLIGEAIDGASADQLPIAIRAARSSAGLSAAELARRAGVSRPTLWSWETGKSRPTKENLANLKQALQMEMGDGAARAEDDEPVGKVQPSLNQVVERHRQSMADELGVAPGSIKISIAFD